MDMVEVISFLNDRTATTYLIQTTERSWASKGINVVNAVIKEDNPMGYKAPKEQVVLNNSTKKIVDKIEEIFNEEGSYFDDDIQVNDLSSSIEAMIAKRV